MFERRLYEWRVQVQGQDGSVENRRVANYWDPEHEGTSQAIGEAGAAQAFVDSGRQVKYVSVSVERTR